MSLSPLPALRIDAAEHFGRVAVLMGGDSSEREISLMTGDAVLAALRARGVDAHAVDARRGHLVGDLVDGRYDRAWIALHGAGDEDGAVQGLLEYMQMPFTGCGRMASALAMDKLRSKQLFAAHGLGSPKFAVVQSADADSLQHVVENLGLPLAVKPNGQGSSVGVSRVNALGELEAACVQALRFGGPVLVEQWIQGEEYTAGIVGRRVLPLIRIDASASHFFDYQAKYFSDETRYTCPCGLPSAREAQYAREALAAFDALGASGWGRVDFMLDGAGNALMLEVNTVPGMTGHSLVPMAAAVLGTDFAELCWRVLETSFDSPPAVEASAAGGNAHG